MGSAHQNGHLWWHSVSRRQFLGAAAAATGALATGLRIPSVLADHDQLATVFPLPIPGLFTVTFPDGNVFKIHHFPPTVPNDGLPINEPSQITDFNGVVGVTRVIGTGVGTTGTLSYQVDNGFMSGLYRGEDGRMHHGTFAFIWMDLFTGAVGTNRGQVHDFNPGIRDNTHLFWTVPVSENSLGVDFEDGFAKLSLHDFDTEDYHNLENALNDGPSDSASVTFDMTWTATGDAFNVTDPVKMFAGRYRFATVGIDWSATAPGFSFTSNPASNVNVKSVFGRERNGIFF